MAQWRADLADSRIDDGRMVVIDRFGMAQRAA
jgi:hypothetical protein